MFKYLKKDFYKHLLTEEEIKLIEENDWFKLIILNKYIKKEYIKNYF